MLHRQESFGPQESKNDKIKAYVEEFTVKSSRKNINLRERLINI
jgi:hypothetical protein